MTRTPTKKPGKRPAAKLSGERMSISLKLPPRLVAEIDAISVAERRTRVRTIEVVLDEFVQTYRQRTAA